jgi:predicted DNA-binding transcriptional regulator AlpA
MNAQDRYLTIADLSLLLRVHAKTILRWRRASAANFPPPVMLGPGSLRWLESDVANWLAWRNELGRLRDEGIDGSFIAPPEYSAAETATEKRPKVHR